MRFKGMAILIALAASTVISGTAFGEDPLSEIIATGCKEELSAYCEDVTPGEGRVLACLYAHEDKLSGQCEYALYDAASQLERFVAALAYAANECGDDLEKYCADVPMGEGRLLDCIEKNGDKVSSRCRQALKDTGLKQED